MPRLEPVSREELDANKKSRTPKPDKLAPFLHEIEDLISKDQPAARVYLDSADSQRSVKRSYTVAGKQLGKTVKWRSAPNGQLLFELIEPNGSAPRDPNLKKLGRPKKSA